MPGTWRTRSYACAPGSEDGLPVAVVEANLESRGLLVATAAADGHLPLQFELTQELAGPGDVLTVRFRVQVCDAQTCLARQVLELSCPVAS